MSGCDEDHSQANSHFMHAAFANELGDNALTVLSRFDAGICEPFHPLGYLRVTVVWTAAALLWVKLQNANSRARVAEPTRVWSSLTSPILAIVLTTLL
jgi:hypothetical protein